MTAKTLEEEAHVRFLTTSEIDNEARGHCDNSDALRIQDFIAGADYVRSEYEPELHSLLAAATLREKELTQLREMVDMLLAKLEAVPVDAIREVDEWELGLDYPVDAAVTVSEWLATMVPPIPLPEGKG